MKMFRLISVALVSAALFAGCAANESKEGDSADASQVEPLLKSARAGLEEVDKLGYAWRDVEDMIKDAEKAAAEGDAKTATSLLEEAISQNKLAMVQYESQKDVGPR